MQTNRRSTLVLKTALLLAGTLLALVGAGGASTHSAEAAGLPPSTACSAPGTGTVTCELWATTGSVTMPDAAVLTTWGYADAAATPAQLPGPTLIVNAGDTVQVTLHNDLGESTALVFPDINMVPDLTGVAPAGVVTYTFTAPDPGTYIYEAGLLPNAQHQVAMGMHGALIVRPVGAPSQALADPATAFQDEYLLVLSELDPALSNSATPATFDMRFFRDRYTLINGKAYPDTGTLLTAAGNSVLLRYVNAGSKVHTMATLGVYQKLLTLGGNALPFPRTLLSELLQGGIAADMLVAVPATATGRIPLYDANMRLNNNGAAGYGGMLTFLEIPGVGPGPDVTGPAISAMVLAPNPSDGLVDVALSASASEAASGGANVSAVEYFIGAPGANGTGTPLAATDGTFDGITEAVNVTLSAASLAPLSSGSHSVYVHGLDSLGNWGPFNFLVLQLDKTGPATTGITPNPAVTSGGVNVAISASGDDSASGGSNVIAAEYFLDAADPVNPGAPGTGIAMAVNAPAVVASLSATIPAATMQTLSEGAHVLSLRSQDAFLNWGVVVTATLPVDKTGPNTGLPTVMPNPTNGKIGVNPITPSIRVDALISDLLSGVGGGANSNVATAEAFIDTVGAPGSGQAFIPLDGVFDSVSEQAYTFLPLTQINQLSDGTHTIYVRGKDAAGNWGATNSVALIVDKTGPTASGVSLQPGVSAMLGVVTASATDPLGTITGAEWFDGADPGVGNGSAMTAVDGTFDSATESLTAPVDVTTWVSGVAHNIRVRARDSAGNWGPAVAREGMRFDYTLSETTGTDFNWIGLPIDTGLATAADLVTHIQTHSSGSVTISQLQRWNAVGQNYQTYSTVPVPGGNFAVAVAGAYRVTVNLPAVTSGTVIWTLVGNVPLPTAFSYSLAETNGTDYNWVLLPFSKNNLTLASHLKSDMEADAVPALTISQVQSWSGAAQNFLTFRTVPVQSGDFGITLGYPYRVTVNVTGVATGTSTWP